MKLPKVLDKMLTVIGYILAFVPYFIMGGYSAFAAIKIVPGDNLGFELITIAGFVLLGVLFMLLQVIIHEGGHLIAGLCTGWKFLSFRVGSLTLVRSECKMKWKKHTVVGTAGQCLMIPPECEYEKCPFYLYLFGGGAADFLTSGIAFFIGMFSGGIPQIICNLFAMLGVCSGLSNLMPAKIAGIMNDGYQIFVELPGDNNAKKNMYCLLSACAILTEAEGTEALPESIRNTILELDGEDFKDVSTVNLLMYKCTILQEQGRYEEMGEICQKIADNRDTLQLFKNEAKCELLYLEIMGECNEEKIQDIYDKKLQDYIKATAMYPSRKRLMYAYHLLYKEDEAEAEKEYQALLKAAETYPCRADGVIEMKEAKRVRERFERSRNICD